MNGKYTIQHLQQYLAGTLAEAERAALEDHLRENPELAEELDALRLEKQVEDELVARLLREKMRRWDQQTPLPSASAKWRRMLILALLPVVCIGGIWWVNQTQKNNTPPPPDLIPPAVDSTFVAESIETPSALLPETPVEPTEKRRPQSQPDIASARRNKALEFYTPLGQIGETSMGVADDVSETEREMEKADGHYQAGEFLQAITILTSLLAKHPDAVPIQAKLGRLYFEAGRYAEAAYILRPLTLQTNRYEEEARWNLLLACLADYGSPKADCDTLLNRIVSDPAHFRHTSALRLQKELQ